jgi:peptidoglycan L-alanyl-D-glutamate endopeptidase CwlK
MYTFSNNSKSKLDTCHPDLIKIMELAISRSKVDFGVSEGNRSLARQNELYRQGKSKINGTTKKGKHNSVPSMAVDIFAYHKDYVTRKKLVYDRVHLAYIGGIVESCAQELLKLRKIKHKIRWGANWDSDGVIDYDQSFDDYPHFELV